MKVIMISCLQYNINNDYGYKIFCRKTLKLVYFWTLKIGKNCSYSIIIISLKSGQENVLSKCKRKDERDYQTLSQIDKYEIIFLLKYFYKGIFSKRLSLSIFDLKFIIIFYFFFFFCFFFLVVNFMFLKSKFYSVYKNKQNEQFILEIFS